MQAYKSFRLHFEAHILLNIQENKTKILAPLQSGMLDNQQVSFL
jgi:hypothetical protein